MKERILNTVSKDRLCAFYNGPIYPCVIAVVVAIGSITGLEVFFCMINCALILGALAVCDSFKPLIINLCTFVYQISVQNSPFYPSYSDHYVSGWRLPVLIIMGALIVLGFAYFIVKNKLYRGLSVRKTPLLAPLLMLSGALFLNGIFSGVWQYKNLIYATAQVVIFLFFFLLLYKGLENEDAESLGSYFAYISMLIALIISVEVIHLYLTSDSIFIDGSVNKVGVALGWGIWNLIGISSVVLIPMNFYGMVKNKHPWLYFSVATLSWLVAILSMSRNTLIFGTLTYAVCILIFCFIGERKKIFRIVVAAGFVCAVILAIVLFDKIYLLFKDFFDKGLSDNGRFALWKTAFKNFIEAPFFGKGFYGFGGHADTFGLLPESAHNTVFQLLSATGVIGFLAYVYYRIKTVIPFIKKPCLMKTMLGISILALIVGSLLDNFIFDIYPAFYMNVALVIAFKKSEKEALGD